MKYEYTGDVPRDFPTLGKRLSKGDIIESGEPLNNPHLQEVKTKKVQEKGSDE